VIQFRPRPAEVGERLDVVVARRASITRTLAQRAIRAGAIAVDGAEVKPSYRLEGEELVAGEIPAPAVPKPGAEDIPVTIRFSDDRVLAVSKPAGLVTHPAAGHPSGTLVNALLALGGPLADRDSIRPGIVHRLDRDTSGLLLIAKDDAARDYLVDAIRSRRVQRIYLALVLGRPPSETGTIEAPVGRHPANRRLMAVVDSGRPAVTHYRTLDSSASASLLEVSLETGRTHQIRVHLTHLGHPVVGDRAYGGGGGTAATLGLARPFLHARRLVFPHPDDDRMVTVDDPLPPDLGAVLERAGLSPAGSSKNPSS
jgi:23S rRNA pseudouridine1911/1915/1917 synthase